MDKGVPSTMSSNSFTSFEDALTTMEAYYQQFMQGDLTPEDEIEAAVITRGARFAIEDALTMWTAYFGIPPTGWELEFWLRDKLNPGAKMAPRTKDKPQTTAERVKDL